MSPPSLSLLRHEAGHAIAGLLFPGAARPLSSRIHHDGISWLSDTKWSGAPDEDQVLASWLGGLLEPGSASGNDWLMAAAIDPERRARIFGWLLEHVQPVLDRWMRDKASTALAMLAEHGEITVRLKPKEDVGQPHQGEELPA